MKPELIPEKLSLEQMHTFNRLGYVPVTKKGLGVPDVEILRRNSQQKIVHTIQTPNGAVKAVVSMVVETPTEIGEFKTGTYRLTRVE